MNKHTARKNDGDLRPEYDLSQLKGRVRGKYYKRAISGTNLVLIEPDLAEAFPDTESVNRALRLLLDVARASSTGTRTRKGSTGRSARRRAPCHLG
jgi:hypothetical protein